MSIENTLSTCREFLTDKNLLTEIEVDKLFKLIHEECDILKANYQKALMESVRIMIKNPDDIVEEIITKLKSEIIRDRLEGMDV